MIHILIVDDDTRFNQLLVRLIQKMGFNAVSAYDLESSLALLAEQKFDLVLLDVNLPEGSSLNQIPAFKENEGKPEVIIMTGHGDKNGANTAIENGAWDYLEKPFPNGELNLAIARVLEFRNEKQKKQNPKVIARCEIEGKSPQIEKCIKRIGNCSLNDTPVLITGETGTGKELFAKAIHENSLRASKPFVIVDCTVLPENLVESVLFGHMKGSFTSATQTVDGLVSQAHGGTLFMDEIGELPLLVQKSLLRLLQEKKYRKIGSQHEQFCDFRLVAATHKNLAQMVEDGLFRKDLFFRIQSFSFELPPLRDREGDIKHLAMLFIHRTCEKYQLPQKGISPDFFEFLDSYSWPGNVRELMSAMDEAVANARDENRIYSVHLPQKIRIQRRIAGLRKKEHIFQFKDLIANEANLKYAKYKKEILDQAEGKYVLWLAQQCEKDVTRAMELSGLGRSRIYSLLKKHGIPFS